MKEKIKNLLLKENGKFISQRINEKFLKKHNIYDFIINSYDDSYTLLEKIYCIINDIKSKPLCKTCKRELVFSYKYTTFCSRECANKDPDVLEKNKKNVSIALKRAYKDHGDEIKQKRINTLFNNYNETCSSPFGISSVQNKLRQTLLNKYGVINVFYLEKFRKHGGERKRNESVEVNKINGYDIEYLEKNKIKVKNLCDIHHDVEIDCITFYNRAYRNRKGVKCPICNPIRSFSSLELEFEKILQELNITDYIRNTKKVINPKELDFYFPSQNLAVELNGVYWHSDVYLDKNYHKNKTDLCEALYIQLLHIWEDDLYDKRDLIKSMIRSKFNLIDNKIYARKCIIKSIDSKTYRNFLDENHIQGKMNSSIKYGLYNNDKLVSVMGFGKLRSCLGSKHTEGIYELHRFCTLKDTIVIGAASKLLNFFKKNINFSQLITYAKRDHSNGNLYISLGFKKEKICEPGYYWLVNDKRVHRYNFIKSKIVNDKNKNMTAIEIMKNNGFIRCYDSGNLKFIMNHIDN